MDKKGDIQLSFNMIFSVILIAIFSAVAIYVIWFFVGLNCSIDSASFIDEIQKDINIIHNSDGGIDDVKQYNLKNSCGKVTHICFYDASVDQSGSFKDMYNDIKRNVDFEKNLYFYPRKYSTPQSSEIKYINLKSLKSNPYCIEIKDNKVSIQRKKSESEVLVNVS